MISAVFKFTVHFPAFVTAFCRSPCIVFQLPLFAAARRVIEELWIVFHDEMVLGHLIFVLPFAGKCFIGNQLYKEADGIMLGSGLRKGKTERSFPESAAVYNRRRPRQWKGRLMGPFLVQNSQGKAA